MNETTADSRYRDAVDFLFERIDYERTAVAHYGKRVFKLDRMRDLLSRMGDPHRGLPVVHIAGTKGKGSTAAMTAAALSAAGYRTGLYTSPHLDRVEERMMIDGAACTPAEFAALVGDARPAVEAMDAEARHGGQDRSATYFELTTAMALSHFRRRAVDVAVVEVGLGGRLDSTNVCEPLVSVITSISFDHMRQLGNTLEAIAREKAGIIKRGVPIVCGATANEPRQAIHKVAAAKQCVVRQLGRDFNFEYEAPRDVGFQAAMGRVTVRLAGDGAHRSIAGADLALLGRHQGANAAVMVATLAELSRRGFDVGGDAIRRALAQVRWPARVEVVARRPTIVIDAAHNVASIAALLATLDESFERGRRILVFATTQEKPIREMLEQLMPRFDRVVFTRYQNNPRGVSTDELAAVAQNIDDARGAAGTDWTVCEDPQAAWSAVRQMAGTSDLVCITGSFFIAAEMRAQINGRPLASHAQGPVPLY